MLRTAVIGFLILAGASSIAFADVYRWVDEHGGVHYSDQWVPGSQLIKSTRPRPSEVKSAGAARSSDASREMTDKALAQADQRNTENAVKQDVAKVRDSQCKQAKDRYEKAVQARRIYKPSGTPDKDKDEDRPPDRQYMSDEEADAYRLQARNDMQDACGTK